MTRSRAFNRFHRWTAKVRRRHLKAWLPEGREGEPIQTLVNSDRRHGASLRDALQELHDSETLLHSQQSPLEA